MLEACSFLNEDKMGIDNKGKSSKGELDEQTNGKMWMGSLVRIKNTFSILKSNDQGIMLSAEPWESEGN